MNIPAIALGVSIVGLIVTLITAAVKITNSINKSAEINAASRAELTESNKALRKSLDDFKLISREEHREFRGKLEEDAKLLAEHGVMLYDHENELGSHEERLSKIERRKSNECK